jgi:hypothetical protein
MSLREKYRDEIRDGAAGILLFTMCGVLGWLVGLAIAVATI